MRYSCEVVKVTRCIIFAIEISKCYVIFPNQFQFVIDHSKATLIGDCLSSRPIPWARADHYRLYKQLMQSMKICKKSKYVKLCSPFSDSLAQVSARASAGMLVIQMQETGLWRATNHCTYNMYQMLWSLSEIKIISQFTKNHLVITTTQRKKFYIS